MASKLAAAFLKSNGIDLAHSNIERANFAIGRGIGKLASPFHIVAVDSRYGTSKRTVGYARTMEDASFQIGRLRDNEWAVHESGLGSTGRGGGEFHDNRIAYYVVDIRDT